MRVYIIDYSGEGEPNKIVFATVNEGLFRAKLFDLMIWDIDAQHGHKDFWDLSSVEARPAILRLEGDDYKGHGCLILTDSKDNPEVLVEDTTHEHDNWQSYFTQIMKDFK